MELFSWASLAIVAGVVSFSSPCTLPLLPGYVSYVSGLSSSSKGMSTSHNKPHKRTLLGALLFMLGFSAVFTALGASASLLGSLLARHQQVLNVISGVLILIMAVAILGVLRVPGLQRQFRLDLHRISRGPGSAPLLGAAFACSWTPCIGPVLAAILSTAASTTTVGQGAVLLLAYSAGLGVPFVLLATGLSKGKDRFGWLRRNTRRIEISGGILLAAMGVAILTGGWTVLMSHILAFYAQLGWPPI
ncbi:cytochrome c biogenesis CcdA family protein [Actinopolyspora halophila]|uniref:cytochrome c biogenesis CcdA family protein n=1 Tax=Actinopolyspora halophila TaxID=1850 RepID=UPI0003AA5FAF|nr:cytochrome c biogenesis CcdA family protein [Actinopolyspora halophila]